MDNIKSPNGRSEPVIWENLLTLAIISLVIAVAGVQLFKRTEFK